MALEVAMGGAAAEHAFFRDTGDGTDSDFRSVERTLRLHGHSKRPVWLIIKAFAEAHNIVLENTRAVDRLAVAFQERDLSEADVAILLHDVLMRALDEKTATVAGK
jgi:hypothetical protein